MAGNGAAEHHGESGQMDIKAHAATYGSVTKLLFWGAIGCAIIAAFVIWLIA